ncbi:hypothetical protein PV379_03715 [Streptomyces caniscabiei]|uniref:hypothetical protein n=1 Tax=Streptomyces caniscabiei TaxID=2746961 RepID=UPI0029AA161F|nr:hypothetical protein [Streptomyces caniscabiei]MDX2776447.1 hypothetical protein [Streptomyces caniscabiei]
MLIFVALIALHAFIFRDVLAAVPAILNNDASIVREELVPFFHFGSQFWGDGASALTSSEEVRVSYSFWTAWVRYNQVLPFALVILNAVSAFILFYAFHRIGRYFYRKSLFGMAAALLAAFLIHAILLYAKIAHFYVLIIGFSMFALSLSLVIEQLYYRRRLEVKNVALVSLLTLLNPAIHYHVIFYFVAALLLIIHALLTLVLNKAFFWKYVRRNMLYLVLLVVFSLVPYVVYIWATTASSMSDVSTQIPVNYWMIYYASLSLPFIFSLDTAGHLDLIRHGNYMVTVPRFGTMIVLFLIASLFIFKRWRVLHVVNRVVVMTLLAVMLFAMWMTIGYSDNSPYSFHRVFGDVALLFANVGGAAGQAVAELMKTFINILRFPHRFQFIYFYAAGLLFMIALVWLRDVLARRFKRTIATVLVILVALFPVIGNGDYRTALFSGDLATFVAPYRIPQDLKDIKSKLASQKDTRLFILPTLESGREIIQDGRQYSFLDKYLIYYLNQPTYYYGVGAKTDNKIVSYLVYRAIAYDEAWWQDILANTIGVTDIVVPQHVEPRREGITYLPDIDAKIKRSLAASDRYELSYDGNDYKVYSLKERPNLNTQTLLDMNWKNSLRYLNGTEKVDTKTYFPLQLASFLGAEGEKKIMTDSIERTYYDILAQRAGKQVTVPNPVSLPFSPQYVASSNFTNNALSLSTLYSKTDAYNYLHENVPSLVNLQRPSFVGLTMGETKLSMKLSVAKAGTYRVLLHAGSKGNAIMADVDGKEAALQKIKDDQSGMEDYVDFTYFYADLYLDKGEHTVEIKNTSQSAVLVDSLYALPRAAIPTDFHHIESSDLRILPTGQQMLYDVFVGEAR